MSNMKMLSLYRRILRLHQAKLPDVARSIGDRYIRQEFQSHLKVTAEQERQFMEQWQEYEAHLAAEADVFGVGRDLSEKEIKSLNDNQKQQLKKIQTTAFEVGNKMRDEQADENVSPGSDLNKRTS